MTTKNKKSSSSDGAASKGLKTMEASKPKPMVDSSNGYELTESEAELFRQRGENADPVLFKLNGKGAPVPDHPSDIVGRALILQSLGIGDLKSYTGVLLQLSYVTMSKKKDDTGDWKPAYDIDAMNFALGLIRSIAPKDQLEAMLAIQMVGVHLSSLKFTARMASYKNFGELEVFERITNKLLRTFTSQMEALRKHRNGSSQNVTVKHVHVHDGGQAIVGNVTTARRVTTKVHG